MTDDVVHAALPDDGAFRSFSSIVAATGLDGDEVHASLQALAAAGRAELVHGRGWHRPGLGPGDADPRDTYMDEQVAPIVARAGHMVQYVGGNAAEHVAPFAYTVGLLERLGFELVVTGALPPQTLQGMLNAAARLDPFPRERGTQVGKVMQPPYMAVLLDTDSTSCDRAGYPLNIARAWWRRRPAEHRWEGFPAVQLVWPDVEFRYPWHARFAHADELGGQPVLGDPPRSP